MLHKILPQYMAKIQTTEVGVLFTNWFKYKTLMCRQCGESSIIPLKSTIQLSSSKALVNKIHIQILYSPHPFLSLSKKATLQTTVDLLDADMAQAIINN